MSSDQPVYVHDAETPMHDPAGDDDSGEPPVHNNDADDDDAASFVTAADYMSSAADDTDYQTADEGNESDGSADTDEMEQHRVQFNTQPVSDALAYNDESTPPHTPNHRPHHSIEEARTSQEIVSAAQAPPAADMFGQYQLPDNDAEQQRLRASIRQQQQQLLADGEAIDADSTEQHDDDGTTLDDYIQQRKAAGVDPSLFQIQQHDSTDEHDREVATTAANGMSHADASALLPTADGSNDELLYIQQDHALKQQILDLEYEYQQRWRALEDTREMRLEELRQTALYDDLLQPLTFDKHDDNRAVQHDVIKQMRQEMDDSNVEETSHDNALADTMDSSSPPFTTEDILLVQSIPLSQLYHEHLDTEHQRLQQQYQQLMQYVYLQQQLIGHELQCQQQLRVLFNDLYQQLKVKSSQYNQRQQELLQQENQRFGRLEQRMVSELQADGRYKIGVKQLSREEVEQREQKRKEEQEQLQLQVEEAEQSTAVTVADTQTAPADSLASMSALASIRKKLTLPSRTYRIHSVHTPRLHRWRVDYVRGLRNKVPVGNYVVMISLHNRLNHGCPLKYSQRAQNCVTPLSQHHSGEPYAIELQYQQPTNHLYLALPSAEQCTPQLCAMIELWYVGNLQSGANKNESYSIDNRQHVVGWTVLPLLATDGSPIAGSYKLPMLKGRRSDKMYSTYSSIEDSLHQHLELWLCNIYLQIDAVTTLDQHPQYVDYQEEWEVEMIQRVKITQSQVGNEDKDSSASTAMIARGHSTRPSYERSSRPTTKEQGKRSSKRNTMNKNNKDTALATQSPRQQTLAERLSSDIQLTLPAINILEPADITVNSYPVKCNTTVKQTMERYAIDELFKNKKRRNDAIKCYQATIQQHQHMRLTSQQKWNYVTAELFHAFCTQPYGNSWSTLNYTTITILLMMLWIRLFIHYCGQILFLEASDVSWYTKHRDIKAWAVDIGYDTTILPTIDQLYVLIAVGPVACMFVFGVLILVTSAIQSVLKHSFSIFATIVLCLGLVSIIDPVAILVVDACRTNFTYGDSFLVWRYYQALDNPTMIIIGSLCTVMLYLVYMVSMVMLLTYYVLHIHSNSTIRDHYHRVTRPSFYCPSDNELTYSELHYVVEQSKQWIGANGMVRKVKVETLPIAMPRQTLYTHWLDNQHTVFVTYIRIDDCEVNGDRDLYRQFLVIPDGTVLEVFDSVPNLSPTLEENEHIQTLLQAKLFPPPPVQPASSLAASPQPATGRLVPRGSVAYNYMTSPSVTGRTLQGIKNAMERQASLPDNLIAPPQPRQRLSIMVPDVAAAKLDAINLEDLMAG